MASGVTITVGRAPIPFGRYGAYGATLLDLPGDMRDAATQVDQGIRAVMVDVDSSRDRIPAGTASAWDSFVTEWEHFTEQDEGAGQGWLYGTGAVNWWTASAVSMDAIHQRQQELLDWRTKLTGILGGLSSPAPLAPPAPTDPLGLGTLGKAVPWIVGGILAYYLLPVILKKK